MSVRSLEVVPEARWRVDWADSSTFIEAIRYLVARPRLDELASGLAIRVLTDLRPASVIVGRLGADGRLRIVSRFGDHDTESADGLSIWARHPMTSAIQTEQVVIERSAPTSTAPDSKAPRLVAAAPLRSSGVAQGAIQLVIDHPVDDRRVRQALSAIAAPVSLYLDLMHRDDEPIATVGDHKKQGELTERQKAIVGMLIEGMTNAQIASRLGFSESTVRQDTMAIYRHLGVSGRRDVAQAAAARGLA